MKKYIIPLVITALIIQRVVYSNMIVGKHGDMYFLKLMSLDNGIRHLFIGCLILIISTYVNSYTKWYCWIGSGFCLGVFLISLYVLFPAHIAAQVKSISVPYFNICAYIATVLLILYPFLAKGKLLA